MAGCNTDGTTFEAASALLLAVVALGGEAAQSPGVWREIRYIVYGPEMRIITATYGINCSNYPEYPPYTNAASARATLGMRRICDQRSQCALPIDLSIAGDPASCAKDFSVAYRCTGNPDIKWLHLPAEAFGKVVKLQCAR